VRDFIPRVPATQTADVERQINIVRLACTGIVLMLSAGLWLKLPYLMMEHRRLEPWKIVELWSADILALIWFIRFTATHAIAGEPLVASQVENGRQRLKNIALIGVAVIVIDLGLTLYLMDSEKIAYERAIVAEAQAMAIHKIERQEESWYEVKCNFKTQTGAPYETYLRVEAKDHLLSATLSPETVHTLMVGTPGPILIRYDPAFPTRAWADGAGWDNGDAIYWFSMLTLFFQAIVTALFLLLLSQCLKNNILPWWWDIYKVLPLAVGAFWLFLMGLIDKLMDSLN
jgi:hypothetical protein